MVLVDMPKCGTGKDDDDPCSIPNLNIMDLTGRLLL